MSTMPEAPKKPVSAIKIARFFSNSRSGVKRTTIRVNYRRRVTINIATKFEI